MKSLFAFLFIFISLENNAAAVTKDYKKAFAAARASKGLRMSKFGISLYKQNKQTGSWEPVLLHNSKKHFIPASISKVLTGVGLLDLHGHSLKVPTRAWSFVKPKSSTLKSNVYIQGGGDPTLVSEKLWLLVNEIKKWGITKIEGDLVFDDSVFDQDTLSGGRSKWNQRAYNAQVSGLAVNWNSVRVRFLDVEPLNIVTDPLNPYFELRRRKLLKKSSQVEIRDFKNKEVLSAFFGKDALKKEKSLYRRVFNPRKSFEMQFVQFLKDAGISYTGKRYWAKTPEGLFELGKVESEAMSRLVELMMKHSNNFIADMLTKFSHAQQSKTSGTYQGGLLALKSRINNIYPFPLGMSYVSASGLSRKNKFSPDDFSKFLLKLQNWRYFPEFLSSLPLSCMDGTLRERLCDIPGVVRAKTGLLAGVSTLAGFYQKNGERYVFTFMYNGSNGDQFGARNTFDNFLEKL